MTWTGKRMKELIERVRVAVRNLQKFPELAARLVRFGIENDRLTLGLTKADNGKIRDRQKAPSFRAVKIGR